MLNLASKARPYFGAVVITVGLLTAGGIYSATRMPSAVFPEVTFPRIAVVARSPGLSVPNMEALVTRPLEQAVTTVVGVAQVRAKTIRGGSELYINFNPGTNMLQAEQFTWNRIGAARSQLPTNIDMTVDRMTPSISPIISLVLTGGNNPSQLRDYAFYELAPRIKNIPDVLYANVSGGDVREIDVEARPQDLLAAGLSAADLADQIGKVHRLEPVGRIEQPPYAFELIVNGQGETARQIEELVISTKNNQPLRVRDVADVKVWHQDRVQSIGYAGKDAVVVTVFRTLGGSTVNISRDLQELLKKSPGPNNIQRQIVYDQARFVSTAVHNVRDAIIVGGFFSILILFAFLRSWRATLLSVLAIPTTLAITFLFLHWTGETLNLMSLGGLAVAIGLIIDDTVVVIENIARHLHPQEARGDGRPRPDPVDAASGEITGAVVGSTLTTVIVFVPLAFIVGVYGQFFASLSWALSIAVLVSMVISLALIPVFASKFLAGRPMPVPGKIYRFLAEGYENILAGTLHHPYVTVAISVFAVVVGVLLFTGIPDPRSVPPGKPPLAGNAPAAQKTENQAPSHRPPLVKGIQTGLMPVMDEGAFTLDYWAPSGTPLEETVNLVRQVEEVLSENPDIDAYVRRTGVEMGIFATQTNRGDIQVVLRPAEEDPLSLLAKPVRPPFEKVEKEMKRIGKENAAKKFGPNFTEAQAREEGKEAIRRKYRRRPIKGGTDNPGIMDEVEDGVKEHFAEHQFKFETVQIMQDELDDLSGASRPVEIKLFGPDYAQLRSLADRVGELLEKNGKGHGIKEVENHVTAGNPDLMIRPDEVKATQFGTNAAEIQRQLQTMYLGQIATQVRESALRLTDVRVRYPDRLRFGIGRFEPDSLLSQWILLPPGVSAPTVSPYATLSPLVGPARAVPLGAVSRIERIRSPDEQWRENQQPVHFVTAAELNIEEAGLNTVVAEIQDWINTKVPMPSGYRWEIGGYYVQQQAAFHSLFIVMVVAVILVYLMLSFQFKSVVLPLLIFMEQPLSLVSGLFALWITNTPLNVSSYMGAILLIGLDMKNGIILVEYIQQLRREGMPLEQAILEAGRIRLRPILMTSLAAILGLLPLALGIGPGAQMQQPLAIMVMGGLTANMLFARMVIRAGYLLLERKKDTIAPDVRTIEASTLRSLTKGEPA